MKRGTTPTLRIEHNLNLDLVKRVDFLFKQKKQEFAQTAFIKSYPDDVEEKDGVFSIRLSEKETRKFKEDAEFYCDPKVTFIDDSVPATEIIRMHSEPTLWSEKW